jgi:hypothetical protein
VRGVLVLLCLAGAGCIGGRGGGVVFPARYDVGPVATSGGAGVHIGAGLSWASVTPDPRAPVDVTLGWVVEQNADPPPGVQPMHGAVRVVHGPYLSVEKRLFGTRHQRTFAGLTGALLYRDQGDDSAVDGALSMRAGWEVFHAGMGRGYMGAVAAGFYVEMGVRQLPRDQAELVMTGGVTFRLPLMAVH